MKDSKKSNFPTKRKHENCPKDDVPKTALREGRGGAVAFRKISISLPDLIDSEKPKKNTSKDSKFVPIMKDSPALLIRG